MYTIVGPVKWWWDRLILLFCPTFVLTKTPQVHKTWLKGNLFLYNIYQLYTSQGFLLVNQETKGNSWLCILNVNSLKLNKDKLDIQSYIW